MSNTTDNKPPTEPKLDWDKALKHLETVEAEVKKLSVFDKTDAEKGEFEGQPRPGMNPAFFYNNVTIPLKEVMAVEANRNQALFLKVLAVQAEPPTVKKFYKPVTFSVKPSTPTNTGIKA